MLIPFLLLFVFLGSFAANNDFADNVVTLIFGALGYFMVLFEWSRAPFVLGLVLGKLAENYLLISVGAYGTAWLLHPTVLVLAAIILVTTGIKVFQAIANGSAGDEEG